MHMKTWPGDEVLLIATPFQPACAVTALAQYVRGTCAECTIRTVRVLKTVRSLATADKTVSNFGVRWSYRSLYLLALVFSCLYGKK